MCGSQIWMVPKVEKGATATMQTTLLPASMLMRGQRNREELSLGESTHFKAPSKTHPNELFLPIHVGIVFGGLIYVEEMLASCRFG